MYTALVAYFDENEKYGLYGDESYSDNFIRFASYTELADGLEEGKVDMIFINGIMAEKYGMTNSFALRAEDPGALSYAVAVYSDKPALATVADTFLVPASVREPAEPK